MLRIVMEGEEKLRIGLKYLLDNRQNYNGVPALKAERISAGLQKALEKDDGELPAYQKKPKKRPGDALRKALAICLNEFPPILIDHALRVAAFDLNTPLEDVVKDCSLIESLVVALAEAQRVVQSLATSITCKGYIISKPATKISALVPEPILDAGKATGPTGHKLKYEDFHPFQPQQFHDNPEITMLEFDSFNQTVDEFFSSLESQRLESRLTEQEENAARKLKTARLDHRKRVGGLQDLQELNIRKAQAIEANLQKVQEATTALNGLIRQGVDWHEIARLIEIEQERDNVVANTIKLPLKLYENTATLFLSEAIFKDDEDDFDGDDTGSDVSESENDLEAGSKASKVAVRVDKLLAVDIDLALSPWSNARQYYEQKRSAAVKEQKTLQSSEKALKSTEKKINADLRKGLEQEKEVMRPQRKAIWFERFMHFISSEGYLVLGGKDTQQNELLYKRYLQKGDKYIHADLQGAASVIVKNKLGMSESPIPPSTLSQAGTLSVVTSSAWDSKAIMSAWWVDANQVSKITPTGELLPNGIFVIQGPKNFLPPARLLLGFGIMFRVSEESKTRHLRHRTPNHYLAPSHFATYNEDKEEFQGEDQHTKADKEEDQGLGHLLNADTAESDSGDYSKYDGEDPMPNNPLQPTRSQQNALHPPNRAGDTLDECIGTGPLEEISAESCDEESENEQEGQIPSNENWVIDKDQNRHLSARERRLLQKGSPAEAPSTYTGQGNAREVQIPGIITQSDANPLSHRVRGKNSKYQKLKAKYADQDEEDRALAMRTYFVILCFLF